MRIRLRAFSPVMTAFWSLALSQNTRRKTDGSRASIFENHGSWYVRWWEKVEQEDGSFKWEHPCHRLVSKEDYPKKSEIKPLAGSS